MTSNSIPLSPSPGESTFAKVVITSMKNFRMVETDINKKIQKIPVTFFWIKCGRDFNRAADDAKSNDGNFLVIKLSFSMPFISYTNKEIFTITTL